MARDSRLTELERRLREQEESELKLIEEHMSRRSDAYKKLLEEWLQKDENTIKTAIVRHAKAIRDEIEQQEREHREMIEKWREIKRASFKIEDFYPMVWIVAGIVMAMFAQYNFAPDYTPPQKPQEPIKIEIKKADIARNEQGKEYIPLEAVKKHIRIKE